MGDDHLHKLSYFKKKDRALEFIFRSNRYFLCIYYMLGDLA